MNLLILVYFLALVHLHGTSGTDYVWNMATDGFSVEEEFGCTTAGCAITKTWEILGICNNPKISVSFIETDFQLDSEQALVYIDDEFIASCEPLNEDSTHVWVNCANINNTDISSYIDPFQSKQTIAVTFNATIDVNCCAYNGYYVYGKVKMECTGKIL